MEAPVDVADAKSRDDVGGVGQSPTQCYSEAYEAHYGRRELLSALLGYREIVTFHPRALEARWARAQMRNIAQLVVPAEELLEAQVELAFDHLERDRAGASGAGQE